MNSRQRILNALDHKAPDRLPLGFFAVDHDIVARILGRKTYLRNKADSTIALWEGRRSEVAESWRKDAIEFYRRMDMIDIVGVHAMASSVLPPEDYEPLNPQKIDDNTWQDNVGRVYRFSPQTHDITCVEDPTLIGKEFTPADFTVDIADSPPDKSCFEVVDAVIDQFKGERFIAGPSGDEASMILLGDDYERGLIEFAMNPEAVKAAHAQALARGLQEDCYYIRDGQDAVLWGTDFSCNSGPMISPTDFLEFCMPNIKRRVQSVKNRGLRVLKHACGNNTLLLDSFIEAGYDCYQSIQESAGVDIESLRDHCAGKMALWGGVKVENLIGGTPEQVREDVRKTFRIALDGGNNGGFILGTSHSVAVGSQYENFMALLDEYYLMNKAYFG